MDHYPCSVNYSNHTCARYFREGGYEKTEKNDRQGGIPPPLCACMNVELISFFFYSDLSHNNQLLTTVIASFNHNNEEVKSAASYALGNMSLGNLKVYLPFVLKEIDQAPKRQYLLLHSLKEVK